MFGTGFLGALVAKLAALGSVAKVAVGTTAAVLTMTVAGAAAGVLPIGGGESVPAVTPTVVTQALPLVDPVPTTPSVEADVQADGASSVAPSTSSASAAADASAVVDSVPDSIPSLPIPAAALPDLSGLTEIPAQVLSCLSPILDLATSLPNVSMTQIGQIGPTIVGCVSEIVEDLPLPFGLNACLSEIMGFVSSMSSHLPTGTPNLGGFNVAACIPAGLPVPTGLPGASGFMGGGFPFGMGGGFPFGG